jgi:ammonium transporter Rh
MIIAYGFIISYSKYGEPATAGATGQSSTNETKHKYPFFQDINVMVFIGFAFLMTFLKTYRWSAIGINFILSAWVIQWSILTNSLWKRVFDNKWSIIEISMETIINAEFAAVSVLVAVGAVLGKLNFFQYIFMATWQTIFYSLANTIRLQVFKAIDLGGTMFIYTFGAIFGLAVSLAYQGIIKDFKRCKSNYNSNTFAFLGTIFLWMYWPSFNSALTSGNAQQRAIINTYLSLTGSNIAVFFCAPIFNKGKLNPEYILNATIAGGVIIANSADIIFYPWVAIIVGFFGGLISLYGYMAVNKFLFETLNLHDTCGINYLHGIPGILGSFIAMIIIAQAKESDLGDSYKILYSNWDTRSSYRQSLFQLANLGMIIGISLISGLICGFILRLFNTIERPFQDKELWEEDDDELELIKWMNFDEIVNSPQKKRIIDPKIINPPRYINSKAEKIPVPEVKPDPEPEPKNEIDLSVSSGGPAYTLKKRTSHILEELEIENNIRNLNIDQNSNNLILNFKYDTNHIPNPKKNTNTLLKFMKEKDNKNNKDNNNNDYLTNNNRNKRLEDVDEKDDYLETEKRNLKDN